MTTSDDLFPPRRRIFFPVVILTALLTIIGLLGGYLLGQQSRANRAAGSGPAPDTSSAPAPSPEPSGELCPEQSRALAAKLRLANDLRVELMVRTRNGTTVWVCRDPEGQFYYQSKTGGYDAPLVDGKNALFLTDVEQQGTDDFLATADDGNTIEVDRERLEIRRTDGRVQRSQVIHSEP